MLAPNDYFHLSKMAVFAGEVLRRRGHKHYYLQSIHADKNCQYWFLKYQVKEEKFYVVISHKEAMDGEYVLTGVLEEFSPTSPHTPKGKWS
jgi:hypothetical protein